MHYIGRNYVTIVYKCDDEKNLMTEKKCDKCIQMHYIGKSYVTIVYKCDDGFLWQKLCRSLRFLSHFWSYAAIGCWGVLVVSLLYGSWLHTGDKPYETYGFIHF